MPVLSIEGQRSCICVLMLSTTFLLDFESVLTVWYIWLVILVIYSERGGTNSNISMDKAFCITNNPACTRTYYININLMKVCATHSRLS